MKNIKWGCRGDIDISILNKETLESVCGVEEGSEEVVFITKSGKAVRLYSIQGCATNVELQSFECGIDDFSGAVVLNAECVETVELVKSRHKSETWSFYRVDTTKGLLWMRWFGGGYYSKEVRVVSGVVEDIATAIPKGNTHVMIDLETMGTVPEMAIVSIGAVIFNPENDTVSGDTFYIELDWKNQDRFICTKTQEWWSKQSEDARSALEGTAGLKDSLIALAEWLPNDSKVWGNGATFDISCLEHAHRQLGIEIPWNFWNVRDCRTVEDMYESAYGTFDKAISRKGHHNALEDAKFQAGYITMMWDRVLNDNQEKQKPLVAHKKGDEQ